MPNPPELIGGDDLVQLLYLEEDDVMESLQARHAQQKVYTAISHIVLAMNPYQRLPIYGPEIIAKQTELMKKHQSGPPHVYGMSANAFRDMQSYKQNQSILGLFFFVLFVFSFIFFHFWALFLFFGEYTCNLESTLVI